VVFMINLPCAEPVTGRSDKKNQSETVSPASDCTRVANFAIPKAAENMDDAGALSI
jgi:hypothetical protein